MYLNFVLFLIDARQAPNSAVKINRWGIGEKQLDSEDEQSRERTARKSKAQRGNK